MFFHMRLTRVTSSSNLRLASSSQIGLRQGPVDPRGYGVLLCDLDDSLDTLERLLYALPLQGVDGLIVSTADDISSPGVRRGIESDEGKGTRVLLGTPQDGSTPALTWSSDFASIARLLREGYLDACREAGSDGNESLIVNSSFNSETSKAQAARILEGELPPKVL